MLPRFLLILLSACWIACSNPRNGDSFEALLHEPPYLELTEQIDHEPEIDSHYFKRALVLLGNQHSEPALLDLKKAWSIHPNAVYALTIVELFEGSPDAQFNFLKEAQQTLPNDYSLEFTEASLLSRTDSIDAALAITTRWIELGRTEAELYLLHASLLDKKGDSAEALRLLEILHRRIPQEREITEMLALRYAESGNTKVVPLCEQLQKLDSIGRDASPYYYLGIYYATKLQRSEAKQAFDRAIQTDHNFIEAYIEKSSLLLDGKEIREALQVLDKALLIAPDHAPVYYWTAKCQQAMGDRESARLNYLKAYGLDNSFLEAKRAADELK